MSENTTKLPDYAALSQDQQEKILDLFRDMMWTKSDAWDNMPEAYQASTADGWRERVKHLMCYIGVRFHDSNGEQP